VPEVQTGVSETRLSGSLRTPLASYRTSLPLEDLLQLVHLYAERGSPKYERAARRWLERYLTEGSPRLQHFAEIATSLARRGPLGSGE
jgi:hypothetical protein